MYRLMIVDDEEGILKALRRELMPEGYKIDLFTKSVDALERAREVEYDLVISDYRMPEMNGVQFLSEFKKIQPDAGRIILSGYTDFEAIMAAINKAEIYRFISKPWHDYELKSTVAQTLEYSAILAENRRLADEVRRQQNELDKQKNVLKRLEAQSPGITQVQWAADGSIIIGDEDY